MPSTSVTTIASLLSIALACACSPKSDAVDPNVDGGGQDASRDGDDDDAAPLDSGGRDGTVACAPAHVLSSDTTKLTLLGETPPLWVPPTANDTIVAFTSDVTSAVVIDELPASPAQFAIVNIPFDRSPARRLTVETSVSAVPQIADRVAYWILEAPSAPALRAIALDTPSDAGAQSARTITTFVGEPVPSLWFIDGDSAYWIFDRPDPNIPFNPSYAVLTSTPLTGDGTHVTGPTLAPSPGPPPGQGGAPYAFAGADVKGGYVYFALIAQSGNPPITSAYSIMREPVAGGTVETLATFQTGFSQIFVTSRFVYWVADLSTHFGNAQVGLYDFAIYQSAHDGSGARVIAKHDESVDLASIPYVHVDGNVLYWFDGPTQAEYNLRAFCE